MLIRLSGIAGLCMILLLGSCNFNKKEDCMALDSHIAMTNDSLLQYGNKWGEELKIAISTLEFSGLRPIRVEMQQYIERKHEEVKKLDNVGDADELIATELKFLEIEKQIVATKLSAFEKFDETATMDSLSAAYAAMQISAIQEGELLEKIHKLRDEYAEKNDIPKYIEKY